MSFKDFMDEGEAYGMELLEKVDPDTFFAYAHHATTFVYLEKSDNLLCAEGRYSHVTLLVTNDYSYNGRGKIQRSNVPETATDAVFGRIAYISDNEHYRSYTLEEIPHYFGDVGIVAVWKNYPKMQPLTVPLLNKAIHKLTIVKSNQIDGFSPVMLPLSKDYYVVSEGLVPAYQISGKTHTGQSSDFENQLKKMAGELHFLPYGSPRRTEITQLAQKLQSSEDAGKYKWFWSRLLSTRTAPTRKKHPYQAEMEKQKLVLPGHKWNMQGENTIKL